MGKAVLIAVDVDSAAEASILYGIESAARTKSSLVLLAISSAHSPGKRSCGRQLSRGPETERTEWRDMAVTECQLKGLDLEVFVTQGLFSEEVIRFVRSRPAVKFVIIAAPRHLKGEEKSMFSLELEHLYEECESEILLVEKAGHVTRVSGRSALHSERENSV